MWAQLYVCKTKRKGNPLTGRETSRLLHFLENRLTDGGDISLTRQPHFTSQEDYW
jgi:hypothetical protein